MSNALRYVVKYKKNVSDKIAIYHSDYESEGEALVTKTRLEKIHPKVYMTRASRYAIKGMLRA